MSQVGAGPARLSRARFLAGDTLTVADIRLWVTLVRYDAGPNARRRINAGLHVYPHLWRYASALYRIPAFRDTTDFSAFAAVGAHVRPGETAAACRCEVRRRSLRSARHRSMADP